MRHGCQLVLPPYRVHPKWPHSDIRRFTSAAKGAKSRSNVRLPGVSPPTEGNDGNRPDRERREYENWPEVVTRMPTLYNDPVSLEHPVGRRGGRVPLRADVAVDGGTERGPASAAIEEPGVCTDDRAGETFGQAGDELRDQRQRLGRASSRPEPNTAAITTPGSARTAGCGLSKPWPWKL